MNFLIDIIKEESPLHAHKEYEILIYTKGSGIFSTPEESFEVSPGKIMIIPPGMFHTSTSDSVCERIFISGPFEQFFSVHSPLIVLDNSEKEALFLANMIYHNRYAGSEYITALINAFAHLLLQNIKIDNEIFLAAKTIIEEITNHFYDNSLCPGALLKKSGYAEDYIRAHFKKITGKTPTRFLNEIRIHHACRLIDIYGSMLSLAEISEKCGFSDYIYFSRTFKQIKGLSPRAYAKGI